MAPINPIKLRNGRPIFVLSEIFTDMIDTHQNLNLILLMPLLSILITGFIQLLFLFKFFLTLFTFFHFFLPRFFLKSLTLCCHNHVVMFIAIVSSLEKKLSIPSKNLYKNLSNIKITNLLFFSKNFS